MQAHKRHTGERFDAVGDRLWRRAHDRRYSATLSFVAVSERAKDAREHVWCYTTQPGRAHHKEKYRAAITNLRELNELLNR